MKQETKQPKDAGQTEVKGEEKLSDLPFDEKYLHNMAWLPSDLDCKTMGEESYKSALDEYNRCQKEVVFENLHVVYDSDGDEYSHSSWPWQLVFLNHTKEVECFYEDDGIYISYNDYHVKFPRLTNLTISKFIKALDMIGCPYELTDFGKSVFTPSPTIKEAGQQDYDFDPLREEAKENISSLINDDFFRLNYNVELTPEWEDGYQNGYMAAGYKYQENQEPKAEAGQERETVEEAFDSYCSNMGYLQTTLLRNLFEYAAQWQSSQTSAELSELKQTVTDRNSLIKTMTDYGVKQEAELSELKAERDEIFNTLQSLFEATVSDFDGDFEQLHPSERKAQEIVWKYRIED